METRGRDNDRRIAFTLAEVMAAVAILGLLAALAVVRLTAQQDTACGHACHVHQVEIELQAELWRRAQGSYPAANLSDIAAAPAYFPEGLPTCPVDGTSYTIDTTTGQVTGHGH